MVIILHDVAEMTDAEMLTEDLFGKILKNWSPNGHLLGSKSPNPLKFLAFFKKWQQNVTFC